MPGFSRGAFSPGNGWVGPNDGSAYPAGVKPATRYSAVCYRWRLLPVGSGGRKSDWAWCVYRHHEYAFDRVAHAPNNKMQGKPASLNEFIRSWLERYLVVGVLLALGLGWLKLLPLGLLSGFILGQLIWILAPLTIKET